MATIAAAATSLADLPPLAIATIADCLDGATTIELTHTCQALYDPDLYAHKVAALSPHIPKPQLRADRARTSAALPFFERRQRIGELLEALKIGRTRSEGIPSSGIAISWKDTPQYWSKQVPEATSPYGRVDKLRSVCWLDISGQDRLAPGDYACLMRIRSEAFWGANFRLELRQPGDSPAAHPFVALTQPLATAGGRDGPGLNSSQLPQRVWLWLYLGRAQVSETPAGESAAPGASGGRGDENTSSSTSTTTDVITAPSFPPDGAPVGFHCWDHGGMWKAGLTVDHVKWVPWSQLPAVLTGEPNAATKAGPAADAAAASPSAASSPEQQQPDVSAGGGGDEPMADSAADSNSTSSSASAAAAAAGDDSSSTSGSSGSAQQQLIMPAIPWKRRRGEDGDSVVIDDNDVSGSSSGADVRRRINGKPAKPHPAVTSLLERGWAVQPPETYWNRTHPGVSLGRPVTEGEQNDDDEGDDFDENDEEDVEIYDDFDEPWDEEWGDIVGFDANGQPIFADSDNDSLGPEGDNDAGHDDDDEENEEEDEGNEEDGGR